MNPSDCPNPESPVCLGTLTAGTYKSQVFAPGVTYTVPDGWQSLEDVPGAYLLVAPGFPLSGVNEGGSDFIDIHTDVAASNRLCSNEAEANSNEPGIDTTPVAIADELSARDGMQTTGRKDVTVGGLSGLELDLQIAPGWTGTCFYAPNNSPTVPALHNSYPSSFDHPVMAPMIMRLYLLAQPAGGTMVIEINDFAHGAHLDGMSAIVETMAFG